MQTDEQKLNIVGAAAQLFHSAAGDEPLHLYLLLVAASVGLSAFIDNIPFAATMIPIIKTLAVEQGVALPILAWALALGTDIGGSATPIGASANVVGTWRVNIPYSSYTGE